MKLVIPGRASSREPGIQRYCTTAGFRVRPRKGAVAQAVLSAHQQEFKALSEKHGAAYIVARSVDDVIAAGL
jgi:hypothetical protein